MSKQKVFIVTGTRSLPDGTIIARTEQQFSDPDYAENEAIVEAMFLDYSGFNACIDTVDMV